MQILGRSSFQCRKYVDIPKKTLTDRIWLVVWNMAFIFPYNGNKIPNWLTPSFFRGVGWNHQSVIISPLIPIKSPLNHDIPMVSPYNPWYNYMISVMIELSILSSTTWHDGTGSPRWIDVVSPAILMDLVQETIAYCRVFLKVYLFWKRLDHGKQSHQKYSSELDFAFFAKQLMGMQCAKPCVIV